MSSKNIKLAKHEKTLLCAVAALIGNRVIVELQDDVVFKGVLEHVDSMMNLTLAQVTSETPEGVKQSYEDPVFLRGRKVRYVHIPKSLDVAAAVEKQRMPAQMRRKFTTPGAGTSIGAASGVIAAEQGALHSPGQS